jgi:hypothetical protein
MAGMLDVGNSVKVNALAGMRRLTDLEKAREDEEEALDRRDAQDKKSNQMTAAGLGAMGGMALGSQIASVGGPAGAVIGGVVGYLAGSLF